MSNYIDYTHKLREVISIRPHRLWLVELALDAKSTWVHIHFWDTVFKVFLCSSGWPGGIHYVAQTGFKLVMVLLALTLVLGSQVCTVTPEYIVSFLRDFQNIFQSSGKILHSHQEKERVQVFPHRHPYISSFLATHMNMHFGVFYICNGCNV